MLLIDCGRFVILEKRRDIDRRYNRALIEFSFELSYGETVKHDDSSKQFTFTIDIDGEASPDWWNKAKDTSRDELLELVYNSILTYGKLLDKISELEASPKPAGETDPATEYKMRLQADIIPGAIPLVYSRLKSYNISIQLKKL